MTWMSDHTTPEGTVPQRSLEFGPYELIRQLRRGRVAERFLAQHPARLTQHVAYRIDLTAWGVGPAGFLDAIEPCCRLHSDHLLPVEQFSVASPAEAWVISPYLGDHDGLLLLPDLIADKGGQLEPIEARRALTQLLAASDDGRRAGGVHGALMIDEVLVDRRGCVQIELYGLGASLRGQRGEDAQREEVRSIVAIGYEMLTGIAPDDARIDASRLSPSLDTSWDEFFAQGLEPAGGFASAAEAIEAVGSLGRRQPDVRIRVRSSAPERSRL
jgi:hypothetical protein